MSKLRRPMILLAGALLLAGTAAQPVSAASGAPAFKVSLANHALSGDEQRAALVFRFTSTKDMPKRGFVRLTIPTQNYTNDGGIPLVAVWGQLQRTHPNVEGYFRVDNQSCLRAKVDSFSASNQVEPKKTIRISVRCNEGQKFTLAWFPLSRYWNIGKDWSPDEWSFPIHTRYEGTPTWKARTPKQLTVAVHPLTIFLPSNLIVPPQASRISEAKPVKDAPAENPQIEITTPAIVIGDLTVHRVEVTVIGERPFVTENGRELVLVNPQNLVDDTPIELVVSGVPGQHQFVEARSIAPFETFSYITPLPGESGYVPYGTGMTFVLADLQQTAWADVPEAGYRCVVAGGEYLMRLGVQWTCLVPKAKKSPSEAAALQAEFASYDYCSTRRVTMEETFDVLGERWEYTCEF